MKTVAISGIIDQYTQFEGESNVTPKTLSESLKEANGEDLLITINSPGGSVFAGNEMFSMIRNYKGKTEVRVVSLAASMGSILALAGNEKTIESTAMYFIHNAQGVGFGDYREMIKAAEWLEDVSSLLADIYSENTTLSYDEARDLMDKDSQFFGSDLADLGFRVVDAGEVRNRASAKVSAIARLGEVKNKLDDQAILNDLEKVAASIVGTKSKLSVKNSTTPTAKVGKNKTEENEIMGDLKNLSDLKAQYPDLYAEAVQKGQDKAMDRVNAHLKMGETSGAMDLAVKNIREGNDFSQTVSAEYMAEGLKNRDINNRKDDDSELNELDSDNLNDDDVDQDTYQAELSKGRRRGGK